MKKSGRPPATKPEPGSTADDTLELPVAPDFLSTPPEVEVQAMLRRIEENMPWRSSRPGEEQRRLENKIDVPFEL